MDAKRPLVPIFAGLSLLSSVSAPELSYLITAFVLALFGWRFWLICNTIAWWTVWDYLITAVSFTRFTLYSLGVGRWISWGIASVAVGGGIVLAVLVPSFLVGRYVRRRLLTRLPRLVYRGS